MMRRKYKRGGFLVVLYGRLTHKEHPQQQQQQWFFLFFKFGEYFPQNDGQRVSKYYVPKS
jgi:hypothetical protein